MPVEALSRSIIWCWVPMSLTVGCMRALAERSRRGLSTGMLVLTVKDDRDH